MPGSPSPPIPPVPAHWTFPANPRSVPRARHAVAAALPQRCRPDLADDLQLLTSELITNAVRHTPHPTHEHTVELVLWPADGLYWLAVSDAGPGTPTPTTPDPEEVRGRGLLLVNALSTTWAVVPRPTTGKSVIAGIRLLAT